MPKFAVLLIDSSKLLRDERWDLASHDAVKQATVVNIALAERAIETVYELEARDFTHVFERLNINHPTNYTFRSLSVGDIIVADETGEAVVVAPFGFNKLGGEARNRADLYVQRVAALDADQRS